MATLTEIRVRDLIADELGVDAAPMAATLEVDLGADSLDIVELVMALEEEFGVEISADYAAGWWEEGGGARVRDLVEYIEGRIGGPAS